MGHGSCLGLSFADEGLGDRGAIGLVGDHGPCAQVKQNAKPAQGSEQGKREADQSCIDADVGCQACADSGDEAPVFSRYSRLVPLLDSFMARSC